MTHVDVEIEGRVGLISLNRPEAMNALTLDMVRGIDAALDSFEGAAAVQLVVLKSGHDRAFCAGGDMRRIRELVLDDQIDEAEQFFREEYALIERVAGFAKPFLSLIDGICMGGGMGLSVFGAYRVATERAVFAMPETAIGFIPDVGASYFLPRLPHSCGLWMGLTGASVRGLDAQALGISTHMTVAETLPALQDDLAFGKQGVDDILSRYCAAKAPRPDTSILAKETACFGQPALRAIFGCLERQQGAPAQGALGALRNASPQSLRETLTLLRNGKELSLANCLMQEFDAMRRAIRHRDLVEGVRAVLVDKDRTPNWSSRDDWTPRAAYE